MPTWARPWSDADDDRTERPVDLHRPAAVGHLGLLRQPLRAHAESRPAGGRGRSLRPCVLRRARSAPRAVPVFLRDAIPRTTRVRQNGQAIPPTKSSSPSSSPTRATSAGSPGSSIFAPAHPASRPGWSNASMTATRSSTGRTSPARAGRPTNTSTGCASAAIEYRADPVPRLVSSCSRAVGAEDHQTTLVRREGDHLHRGKRRLGPPVALLGQLLRPAPPIRPARGVSRSLSRSARRNPATELRPGRARRQSRSVPEIDHEGAYGGNAGYPTTG